MRELKLTNYTVRVREESGNWVELPYVVRDSIVELLLSRELRLSGRELLKHDDLARKINTSPDGSILLEEEEWATMVQAIETVHGLGRTDVELVRRILDAPKVEVQAKK
jgi:hypothetical protein